MYEAIAHHHSCATVKLCKERKSCFRKKDVPELNNDASQGIDKVSIRELYEIDV